MKLNLGSGQRKLEGYINIDNVVECEPDLVLDLDVAYWPFDRGSVEEIRATHVLEHCADLSHVMRECYRAMAPGALMHIAVPHPAGDAYYGDPTHRTPVTINTLRLFSKAFCLEAKEKDWPNTPLALYLAVDFEIVERGYTLTPPFQSRRMDQRSLDYAMTHYINVISELTFVLRRV